MEGQTLYQELGCKSKQNSYPYGAYILFEKTNISETKSKKEQLKELGAGSYFRQSDQGRTF